MADDRSYYGQSGIRSDAVVLFVQEMFIDLFGIVIPGFCFLVITVPAIGYPVLDLMQELGTIRHLGELRKFVNDNTVIAFIAIMIFSYIVGHLLFRHDPKSPDVKSIERLPKNDFEHGCVRVLDGHCEIYPYGSLKEYLIERGFDELGEYVTWSGKNIEDKDAAAGRRSKQFINALKLSVKATNSRLFFEIIKNEAHIRLMSSVWYLCRAAIPIAVCGTMVSLLANYFGKGPNLLPIKHIESLVFAVSVIMVAKIVQRNIERFFHYQRVREIIFVLQAWHLVRTESKNLP